MSNYEMAEDVMDHAIHLLSESRLRRVEQWVVDELTKVGIVSRPAPGILAYNNSDIARRCQIHASSGVLVLLLDGKPIASMQDTP